MKITNLSPGIQTIERLFKLWKSHGQVDAWRSANPIRILCEVDAKLIGVVIHHWILVASNWADPERSLFKAAQIVTSYAGELASAHDSPAQVLRVLTKLARVIARLARTNKRQKIPTTAQRLLALTAGPATQ